MNVSIDDALDVACPDKDLRLVNVVHGSQVLAVSLTPYVCTYDAVKATQL